ncbi:MAG: superoxide dismutase, Ni [Anaerolineae bacterium]|jgi:nickel superoxide dismutase|nr:superoxide dismutase, Ni [Anaerolineae bacterium]MBT3712262.1 superoxide dismutase, Ni [Anaerolineae bacterium]MBT4310259.1 superoxide dismutase, Ni [Anaerolineae bacterium]MBT4460266.1 superoxide dismutase, Ni [Anaerolineae bacterium]MBT6059646.1 superoxide dismutase, Ni [Anaerolineae bacterium]
MFYHLFDALDKNLPFARAEAHCDVPCGIYDPSTAQISALTVVRMMDLMATEAEAHEHGAEHINSMARYIAVKEEHAEQAKQEVRIIWGDYFKKDKHPNVDELVHKIMQLGSASRQTADRENGVAFVEAINEFSAIFWETKGVATKKAKAPYAPALEMVYPDL